MNFLPLAFSICLFALRHFPAALPEPTVGYNIYSTTGCRVMYWADWTPIPRGWTYTPVRGCHY